MPLAHFSNYPEHDEAVVAFSEYCRAHGLPVGLSHTEDALRLGTLGFSADPSTFRYALRALFCTCEEEHPAFDRCFNVFWRKSKHEYAHKTNRKNKSNVSKKANASLVMAGFQPKGHEPEKESEDAKSVSGGSRLEALKTTDFSKLTEIDSQLLDELAESLLRELNHRLKRRLESTKRGRIDLRRTIRANLSNGDLLLELKRRSRQKNPYRLILLLDVSGSMDKYSFFLLKFLWSLKSSLRNIEAFVFSTKLVRVTDFLHQDQLDETLTNLSRHADNWSGGTRIGFSLQEFNQRFAKRILNGKSVTMILSDGLDVGDPELLSRELQEIRMRTSKLVWLNPLKGMEGYEPTAKGMSAAMPEIDNFESAHNLQSLLQLEQILADV